MRDMIFRAYEEAKSEDDFIVFFRQNNYYVALFDDAKLISTELRLPLLSKEKNGDRVLYVIISDDMLVSTLIKLDQLTAGKYNIIETIEFEL